ncbi:MAG: hypothetical protein NT113_12925, partial [Hyphomicrobiales bacterium]|nr:hypothetical protein [Hyphomicrobiales bacterium]
HASLIAPEITRGREVSASFVAAVLVVMGAITLRLCRRAEEGKWSVLALALAVVGGAILTSRFWANWVSYATPLKRVDGEQAAFAAANLNLNLSVALHQLFPLPSLAGNGDYYALSASLGATVWWLIIAVLASCALRAIPSRKPSSTGMKCADASPPGTFWLSAVAAGLIAATLLTMAMVPSYPWTFRYFLPGVLIVILIVFSLLPKNSLNGPVAISSAALIVVTCINLAAVFRPGELVPGGAFSPSRIFLADTLLKRISLNYPFLIEKAAVDELHLDDAAPKRIIVFQRVDAALASLFGSRAQNSIEMTASLEQLLREAAQRRWDVVAISHKRRPPSSILDDIATLGYDIVVNNEYFMLAVPVGRVKREAILSLSAVDWRAFGEAPHVGYPNGGNQPEVESDVDADVGVVSQSFRVCGLLKVVARVEGEVASSGADAAHISLHGETKLLSFKPGRYTSRRLSFGLGGWSVGRGRLRLVDLQLTQLALDPWQTGDLK